MHDAAWYDHKEIAELLIAEGADVNAKDDNGRTPLMDAARKGNKEIVELLIAEGADVNAWTADGGTPLDWANSYRRTETFDIIRKHGGKKGKELRSR